MSKTSQSADGFDIYAVNSEDERGLIDVSDSLHRTILERLSKGPMSTTEISEISGKAQSTLSVHLDQMVGQKLIRSEYDKNDSRRKMFYLTSTKIASSQPASNEGIEEAKENLAHCLNDESKFFKYMFRSVLMSAESNGMDICPMMELLGSQLAQKMVNKVSSRKIEDVIKDIQEFYERNDLGEVCIYTFLPLTIIIHETEETQYKFTAFASFSHGLFKSLLSQVTEREYTIVKSEIFGTGNNYYKFVIDLA